MKYIMVIGDGMADHSVEELGGRTPLEVAEHHNMDRLASQGIVGTLNTIPPGMDTGSDVAILSILGYDSAEYHTGRGPLEAVAAGVNLSEEDIALRCNIITEKDGVLEDYTAGHISTEEAKQLMESLQREFGSGIIHFYTGVSYRNILVLRGENFSPSLKCHPPHDVVGLKISDILINPVENSGAKTARLLNRMMLASRKVLSHHAVNLKRIERGERSGNMMWVWSPGRKPALPLFQDKYGVKAGIISAVNIVKGIGILAGMDVVEVPGATGYFDTDYEAKADYALKSIETHDIVIVHVEATDEAGHMGDAGLKIKAIEDLDSRLIARLLSRLEGEYIIAVLPDHATPLKVRRHTSDPVPFLIYSSSNPVVDSKVKRYDERSAEKINLRLKSGSQFMSLLLKTL